MKKSGFVLKLIASIIIMALGGIMFIIGIGRGLNAYTVSSWYESYGGDAYTGIQNALSDAASYVDYVVSTVEDIACTFFIFVGIIVIGLGLYVLGTAIADKAMLLPAKATAPQAPAPQAPAPQAPVYQAPVYQAPTYQPPQAPVYQPPQAPAYQPPQAPAYQPPQAPAYQPPQAPVYQPPQAPAYQAPASGRDHSAELAKYENLLARGIITQEEFEAKKKQILGM